jgi:formylglycine-generating enzyme required for sulfatase activity
VHSYFRASLLLPLATLSLVACTTATPADGPTPPIDPVVAADGGDIACVAQDACSKPPADAGGGVEDAADAGVPSPKPVDLAKNGHVTEIECGGAAETKCPVGHSCFVNEDCASNGCSYDHTCAAGATCTQLEGGQTCGPNESLDKQSDCCARATVGGYTVDKHLVTAGRMRAFLARVDGNVQAWASTLPAERWNQAWTPLLPSSVEGLPGDPSNANTQLGPFYGKRACATGSHTGHTFWTPPSYGDTKDFSQAVLDTKALNCVPWHLLAALCAFDGGHLLHEKELRAAYTNAGTTAYPWGARGTYTTTDQNDYAIGLWSYFTPDTPATAGQDPSGFLDVAFYIAPPGRRPLGYSAAGVTDLVGNLLEWVLDSEKQFVWKGSFENHGREADALNPPMDNDPYLVMRSGTDPWHWPDVVVNGSDPDNVNGYYALGGRCGY